MTCPTRNVELRMTERQGVEIDDRRYGKKKRSFLGDMFDFG